MSLAEGTQTAMRRKGDFPQMTLVQLLAISNGDPQRKQNAIYLLALRDKARLEQWHRQQRAEISRRMAEAQSQAETGAALSQFCNNGQSRRS